MMSRFLEATDVDTLVESCPRSSSTVVIVDGRSGAGKSELAILIAARWRVVRNEAPTLVRMEDIYPGWHGLDAGSRHIFECLLRPRSFGRSAAWRRFDWAKENVSEWTSVDPNLPLIVEGCGALSRAIAPLASLTLWLDERPFLRKERALHRYGPAFESNWERWAKQETAFFERERPDLLADVVVQSGVVVRRACSR